MSTQEPIIINAPDGDGDEDRLLDLLASMLVRIAHERAPVRPPAVPDMTYPERTRA